MWELEEWELLLVGALALVEQAYQWATAWALLEREYE